MMHRKKIEHSFLFENFLRMAAGLLFIITSVACTKSIFSGNQKSTHASTQRSISEKTSASREIHDSVKTLNQLRLEQVAELTLKDFYAKALEQSSNQPIRVYGQTLFFLRDFLIENEERYQKLADVYPTFGDYLRYIGVADVAEFGDETLERGYSILANEMEIQDYQLKYGKDTGTSSSELDNLFLLDGSNDSALVAAAAPGSNASNAAAANLSDYNHKPKTCEAHGGQRCGCDVAHMYDLIRCVPSDQNCTEWCSAHMWTTNQNISCPVDERGTPIDLDKCENEIIKKDQAKK